MSRGTWVYRDGKLVPKHKAAPRFSNAKMRQVISDDLGTDLEHHGYGDGRQTASKSEFRRWTKEAGLTERGNDREPPRPMRDPDLRPDVARALEMVKNGYRPNLQRE